MPIGAFLVVTMVFVEILRYGHTTKEPNDGEVCVVYMNLLSGGLIVLQTSRRRVSRHTTNKLWRAIVGNTPVDSTLAIHQQYTCELGYPVLPLDCDILQQMAVEIREKTEWEPLMRLPPMCHDSNNCMRAHCRYSHDWAKFERTRTLLETSKWIQGFLRGTAYEAHMNIFQNGSIPVEQLLNTMITENTRRGGRFVCTVQDIVEMVIRDEKERFILEGSPSSTAFRI